MFQPLSLYIGLRYTRAKRSSYFISFISMVSMIGIALAVAVLITVLSVMNGFDEQIEKRFFGMVPEINVFKIGDVIADWKDLSNKLKAYPGVKGVAPAVSGQGLLSNYGFVSPAMITGILPEYEDAISSLSKKVEAGKLSDLKADEFNVILGERLAANLGVALGDKVTLMIPKVTVSIAGVTPTMRRFNVVGIFSAGAGFGFDAGLAYINMHDAQKLYRMTDTVTSIRLRINNIYDAPRMSAEIVKTLPAGYQVSNWTDQFGAFFKAVKMEKTMMFMILTLIIAVAAFNLVSSLVMIVNDKQSDIAILRTFGALPKTILKIFMVQGSVVGLFGTLLGVLGGIILSLNATVIADWLQHAFNMQLLSSNIYFVDYLPSKLEWMDVLHISLIAVALSFAATIYPAWRASRMQPAEALRYD